MANVSSPQIPLYVKNNQKTSISKPRMISIRNRIQTPNKKSSTPNISVPRRRMSTGVHPQSPEQTFMEQFFKQVTEQKKQIHVIRKGSLKENLRHQLNCDKIAIKPKQYGCQMEFGTDMFDLQNKNLEKLINRNNRAMVALVQNRKELLELCISKELRPVS